MPVAVIVDERAAGVPPLARARDPGFLADIAERAIPVVVIQHVFPEVGDEQIVEAVVVVVADANSLAPS